jgi:ABC-type uncharacterized transport system involved in gliding motility auxiliary subunit
MAKNDKKSESKPSFASKVPQGAPAAPTTTRSSERSEPRRATPRADAGVSPAARQRAESLGFLAIAAGVLIALNVVGVFLFFRADATQNEAYSLSEGSIDTVSNLDETLTVTAYFTADLPAPFNATERYVRDILTEYQQASSGHMVVRFVSPDTDDEREEANRQGVQLVQHQHIENDAVSVVEGYRGIVFEYLGEHHTIPVIQPDTEGLEYSITMAIRQLTGETLEIGVLTGHDGPTLTKGLSTWQRMLPTYHITEVSAASDIDPDLHALIVVDPHSEIPEAELRHIDAYVMQGGSLGVFGGTMAVDLQSGPDLNATATHSGINNLLNHWGINIGENIVADAQCGRVPMRTPIGLQIPVAYPPAPIVTFDETQRQHPVLLNLDQTPLFFTPAITTTDAFRNLHGATHDSLGARVLMRSSGDGHSWLLEGSTVSLRIRDPREWRTTMGGESGPFDLAVAIEAELPSAYNEEQHTAGDAHVLVVGTATVIRDEFLPQQGQMQDADLAGAMAFALNSVDWLAQDAALIAIRAKSIEEPALAVPQSVQDATAEAIEVAESGDEAATDAAMDRRTEALDAWESRKQRYRWGNTLLIPLGFAAFGVVRWRMRSNKKASLRPGA